MRAEDPRPIRLADYRPTDFLIDRVDLDVSLGSTASTVRARLSMRPNPQGVAGAPLVLDGDELVLERLLLDGVELGANRYAADPQGLVLHEPPQGPFELEIITSLRPDENTKLMGLYRTSGTWCTQCEAEGFRRITYFLDRPDVLAVYTTRIEASKSEAPVLLSNGNLTASGDLEGGRHFAVWHDPFPKPSYLFALVGGDLGVVEDSFRTMSGRDVALKIYVEHGREPRATYAMDALKRSMAWDERVFGREYDLDIFMIVAVSDFNMGAMENKGLNIFNDRYVLASPETATDGDYAGIEAVIAHEYFHNWTGDRITCRDWFQLCLKEGLTVFRDQEFSSDERSRAVKRIADVRLLRSHQFTEDSGPLAHPVRPQIYHEINNFYTATVYEKGAEVVRMLKVMLGADAFRRGMDLYFERHDGEAATVEDFITCFADVSGRDMSQFMLWYSQAGTPEVRVISDYDAESGRLVLNFKQTVPPTPGQPVKEPMVIPIALALLDKNGQELPLQTDPPIENGVFVLSERAVDITFEGLKTEPKPSLLRGFSAPIQLRSDLSGEDLLFLGAHDTDPFGRWQGLQTYATRRLLSNIERLRSAETQLYDAQLIEAVGSAFSDTSLEPAFAALLATLPGETDLAREIGSDVDPDAVRSARETLRADLSTGLRPILLGAYERCSVSTRYSPDAASAGRRSLRAAALDLLCASKDRDALALAAQQYRDADNMTDRMAALGTLAVYGAEEREAALADFYQRFENNPLVIDKWLAVQAAIPDESTPERVRGLVRHPAFSMANPNRVRSLFGSFAANPTQFNRADGVGFELIADIVLELDPRNPQVAARLLATFKTWRLLEPHRRSRAEAALQRVAATSPLSPDVSDIVRRALEDPK